MAIELNRRYGTAGALDQATVDEALRSYMLRVYNLMASGLALSGIMAVLTYNFGYAATVLPTIAIFVALGTILVMSFGANKLSASTLGALYWAFTATFGIALSTIFMRYTGTSILRVFFITGGMFAAMSLYGYTTKRDLSGFGSFLMMGVIGLLIAGLVNIFLQSSMMQFVISVITVLVFVGLTAYDTQRIKSEFNESDAAEITSKQAIFGAVSLYTNFINIFTALLNLFGSNRE